MWALWYLPSHPGSDRVQLVCSGGICRCLRLGSCLGEAEDAASRAGREWLREAPAGHMTRDVGTALGTAHRLSPPLSTAAITTLPHGNTHAGEHVLLMPIRSVGPVPLRPYITTGDSSWVALAPLTVVQRLVMRVPPNPTISPASAILPVPPGCWSTLHCCLWWLPWSDRLSCCHRAHSSQARPGAQRQGRPSLEPYVGSKALHRTCESG